MAHIRGTLLAAPLLALTIFLTGCPKRPATTAVSAPAPGVVTPPAPASPGTSSMTPSSPSTSTPSTAAPSTPSTAAPAAPAAPTTGTSQTPPRPSEFVANPNLKDIYFDFDKYDIRPDDAKILDSNAQWLTQNPGNLVLIEGHCDERGTAEYNLALGERRAKSTMNYLVSRGVPANRITIISYGKERPVCSEKTEACWAKNRRSHHLVKAQ
jgi:peptidoglycan-associated lipoprotein